MSRRPQSKDEALEALDFIVNVLKEHEKDLDKLIGELGTVTEQIGVSGDLTGKVEKVEEKVNGLQNEISNLITCLSTSPRELPVAASKESKVSESVQVVQPVQAAVVQGPPVILRCKQWEDFVGLAVQAQTMSFMVKEAERTYQVDALKGNQIVTYSGELPKLPALLKVWLGKQLDVGEKKVLEGVLAIG